MRGKGKKKELTSKSCGPVKKKSVSIIIKANIISKKLPPTHKKRSVSIIIKANIIKKGLEVLKVLTPTATGIPPLKTFGISIS